MRFRESLQLHAEHKCIYYPSTPSTINPQNQAPSRLLAFLVSVSTHGAASPQLAGVKQADPPWNHRTKHCIYPPQPCLSLASAPLGSPSRGRLQGLLCLGPAESLASPTLLPPPPGPSPPPEPWPGGLFAASHHQDACCSPVPQLPCPAPPGGGLSFCSPAQTGSAHFTSHSLPLILQWP